MVVQLQSPDLFLLVHIKEALEAAFQRQVDVIHYRQKMNPDLKRRIEQKAVYVCAGIGTWIPKRSLAFAKTTSVVSQRRFSA